MPDCCNPGSARYEDVFDARFARDLARRYRRRGATRFERRMVEHLASLGVDDRTVLEIGGGIGELQLELLARGAAHTTNVELSGAYEGEAVALLEERGVARRATRIVGVDVAVDGDRVPAADYVILHRVVCCYPHAEQLLAAAARHTWRALVFSHPPRTWLTRSSVAFGNAWMRVRGHEYRGFIHSPGRMYDALADAGLAPAALSTGPRWWVVAATRAAPA
ncbi:SAM-dependent methyltransferase [Agromyces sp. NPDC056523]|uniref:SAM-dependent methyltransferase n=1 Tax=Agromyces sp. NPDC056523 TaxID=3345850 RepID=UPI00367119D5